VQPISRVLLRLLPPAVAVAVCAVGLAASAGHPRQAAPESERLPDLDQEVPSALEVTAGGRPGRPIYRLGFRSAVSNVGAGPLIVSGERLRTARPAMTADQLIEQANAPESVVEDVGRLRYVRSEDHEHWHLLRFERYELHRAGERQRRVADRKTGFCLGDRYSTGLDLPAQPPAPVYTSRCGLGATARLRLVEGISVGYGDDYPANLEGQWLPLTGLEAGRYVLVHRVNAGRRLRESSYANNAASVLFRLRWRGGVPSVRELYSCPDTARCEERGAQTDRSASVGERRAARRAG
jgi:Lysyl oxidase